MKKGEQGYATAQQWYCNTRRNATRKDREFPLSLEEFVRTASGNCKYCGELPPDRNCFLKRNGASGTYYKRYSEKALSLAWIALHGLDRKDNNLGYTLANVVSCCAT